jgi:hypothetical protein
MERDNPIENFAKIITVGGSVMSSRDYAPDVADAVDYLKSMGANDGPAPDYCWALKLAQNAGGYHPFCADLPDYVSVFGEWPGTVLGGDADSANGIMLEVGRGAIIQNLTIAPRQADKLAGLLVRDATMTKTPTPGPYNVNGLTIVVNGVDGVAGNDETVTFATADPITAADVATEINGACAHVYAIAMNNKVYLLSQDSPGSESLTVRSTGTANAALGFSTTADLVKSRADNGTTYVQNCSILGKLADPFFAGQYGFSYGGIVSADKSSVRTIFTDVAVQGGLAAGAQHGVTLFTGAPLFNGGSVRGFGNGGAAWQVLKLFGSNFLALDNTEFSENTYDAKLTNGPGLIIASGMAPRTFDPAGDAAFATINSIQDLIALNLPTALRKYFITALPNMDTAMQGVLEFARTVRVPANQFYLSASGSTTIDDISDLPCVDYQPSSDSYAVVRVPIPAAAYSVKRNENPKIRINYFIDSPPVPGATLKFKISHWSSVAGEVVAPTWVDESPDTIVLTGVTAGQMQQFTKTIASGAHFPPPMNSEYSMKLTRLGASDTYAGYIEVASVTIEI